METKFTKGEWTLEKFDYRYLINLGRKLLITVGSLKATDIPLEEREANAHLVVNAPQMYDAIEKLLACAELNQEVEKETVATIFYAIKTLKAARGEKNEHEENAG